MFYRRRGTGPHTAYIFKNRKLHYRHHPLFGREVEVFRHSNRVGDGDLIVRLPDDTWCAVPQWMLEEGVCARLVDAPTPLLSVRALRSLIRLLDSQREGESSSGHDYQPSAKTVSTSTSSSTSVVGSGVKHNDSRAGATALEERA